jgi:hypothetical protein
MSEEFDLFTHVVDSSAHGVEYDFYGVDDLRFCLSTPGGVRVVFEAIEDEGDGYRSYLKTVTVSMQETGNDIFFRTPIARVKVSTEHTNLSCVEDFDGYYLVDVEDGHVWLYVGTADISDYYPGFIFRYEPKISSETLTFNINIEN